MNFLPVGFFKKPRISFFAFGLLLASLSFLEISLTENAWASGSQAGAKGAAPEDRPLKVVTTTGIVADLVAKVAKDLISENRIEIKSLMGPGVDPHAYKASHGDIATLRNADLVFYNGLTLEGKMEKVLEALASEKPVVALSANIPREKLLAAEAYENAFDPHIWFDLELWSLASDKVLATFQKAFPDFKSKLEASHAALKTELGELDTWAKSELSQIPEKQRTLITAHDAFRYFGRRYGIDVQGLQGISSASDYGLQDIKRLKDLIIQRGVKAIFVESSVPERFIVSLKNAVTASGGTVSIGDTLYSDALGDAKTGADTFSKMFRHNVNAVKKGLK